VDILEIVKSILSENLSIEPEEVNSDSTFDSLSIDSLDLVELICALEDHCAIEFGDPEGLETVGDLVTYVEELQAASE